MKLRAALLVLFPLILPMTACTTMKPEQIAEARQNMLGSWTLQTAAELPTIPGNILLTLRPDSAQDEKKLVVNGFSGVNHFVGNASVKWPQQQLVFGALASTRMMGPEPRMQFEQAFLKQMGEVGSFKLDGNQLELKTLSGATLIFLRGAQ
ncbi:MAG: META domain-containing protein [Moraxellaceae bacterium]